MNRKSVSWTLFSLALGGSLCLGFVRGWDWRAWLQLGLVLSSLVIGWLLQWRLGRWTQGIAGLPPEERKYRLASLPPEQRRRVVEWIKSHEG
jgi:hypothetical protein